MDSSTCKLILVVEDETLVSLTIEEMLVEAGFHYFAVVSAREGIAALEEDAERYCALLTDIRMPGEGSGWDVARRARQLRPLLPIIYMTGDSAAQWRAEGVPGSILLQKPFVEAQLMTALAGLLNDAGMNGTSE